MVDNKFIEHDGKTYARISQIASQDFDFSTIPRDILERKMKIGTEVHDCIDKGEAPDKDSAAWGYYCSYVRWREMIDLELKRQEERFFDDELLITGQIDGTFVIPSLSSLERLVDFKTSASPSPSWVAQAFLYQLLLRNNGVKLSDTTIFLQLRKDGRPPKIHTFPYREEDKEFHISLIDKYWQKHKSLV
jgi:hypothetical protein